MKIAAISISKMFNQIFDKCFILSKKGKIFASSFISANKISVHSRCDIFVPELEALKATLIEPGPGKWYLISL